MKEQHHHHIQEIVITDDVGKLWYSFLHLELMHYELHIWIIEEKKKNPHRYLLWWYYIATAAYKPT